MLFNLSYHIWWFIRGYKRRKQITIVTIFGGLLGGMKEGKNKNSYRIWLFIRGMKVQKLTIVTIFGHLFGV